MKVDFFRTWPSSRITHGNLLHFLLQQLSITRLVLLLLLHWFGSCYLLNWMRPGQGSTEKTLTPGPAGLLGNYLESRGERHLSHIPKPKPKKITKQQTTTLTINWYQNIAVGILPIYSLDQFSILFRLVVVLWRRSNCVWNGTIIGRNSPEIISKIGTNIHPTFFSRTPRKLSFQAIYIY